MRGTKSAIFMLVLMTTICGLSVGANQAVALTLPDPILNALPYGDAYSYSLPILAYYYDQQYGGGVGPSNPFYIGSSPGEIKDLVVIATGSDGQPVTTNYLGMDNAYPTPSGVNGSTTFDTKVVADPGGAGEFTGDSGLTWDTRISALNTFLNGESLAFLFNNNQTNSGDAINQTLYAWGQLALVDDAGALPTKYFYFGNYYPPPAGSTPDNWDPLENTDQSPAFPGSLAYAPFVISGGQVCIDTNGAGAADDVLVYPCPAGSLPADYVLFNHNLGANQAAYALVFPEVNAILASGGGGYDSMSLNIMLGNSVGQPLGLNNGYEQIFIMSETNFSEIPEPSTLFLVGAGFVALALAGRKRFKR